MRPNNPPAWFILVMYLASVVTSAQAADSVPINVTVEIDAASMKAAWVAAALPGILAEARKTLASHLQKTFRYWDFKEAIANPLVSVTFRALEPTKDLIALRLEFSVGGQRREDLTRDWLKPGDIALKGYPAASSASASLSNACISILLNPVEPTIRDWFKNSVPIAVGGRWLPPASAGSGEPRIVLPLSWEKYLDLSKSVFRLECKWPPKPGTADLESLGEGISAQYQADPPSAPYDALVVVPLSRSYIGEIKPVSSVISEIRQLQPFLVFLKEYRHSSAAILIPSEPNR